MLQFRKSRDKKISFISILIISALLLSENIIAQVPDRGDFSESQDKPDSNKDNDRQFYFRFGIVTWDAAPLEFLLSIKDVYFDGMLPGRKAGSSSPLQKEMNTGLSFEGGIGSGESKSQNRWDLGLQYLHMTVSNYSTMDFDFQNSYYKYYDLSILGNDVNVNVYKKVEVSRTVLHYYFDWANWNKTVAFLPAIRLGVEGVNDVAMGSASVLGGSQKIINSGNSGISDDSFAGFYGNKDSYYSQQSIAGIIGLSYKKSYANNLGWELGADYLYSFWSKAHFKEDYNATGYALGNFLSYGGAFTLLDFIKIIPSTTSVTAQMKINGIAFRTGLSYRFRENIFFAIRNSTRISTVKAVSIVKNQDLRNTVSDLALLAGGDYSPIIFHSIAPLHPLPEAPDYLNNFQMSVQYIF